MSERLSLFAVTAPGLEPLCAEELRGLGVAASAEPGGVAWEGTAGELYRANLWLRTASRVTVRAATFNARGFVELERHAKKVEWARWVAPGGAVRLRVSSSKSKLYHEGAIAERLFAAIDRAVGGIGEARSAKGAADEGEEAAEAGQLFVVRVLRDAVTISADSSGELLHRRGYRQALAKAPLRETLAAAMLLGSGWRGEAPLVDPMCGSGTLVIEGALMARGVAPGLALADREPRAFAFKGWPGFDADLWRAEVERAREAIRPSAGVAIHGSDRDEGAVAAAQANAARAGVEGDVVLSQRPVSAVEPPPGPGWVVSNPPYGVRVGERDPLRSLYAALGRTLRARCPGWTLALLSADRGLEGQVGVRFREAFRTRNGGIPVHLAVGAVEGGE
jgi:putative N6-adenine-specific DNA methylase